jgi:hypothetical protein
MKTVEALVLIADGRPDSEGEMFHLTGRTIQDKVPVTIDSRIAYSNWVGYASLELRGDKLYASFEGRGTREVLSYSYKFRWMDWGKR